MWPSWLDVIFGTGGAAAPQAGADTKDANSKWVCKDGVCRLKESSSDGPAATAPQGLRKRNVGRASGVPIIIKSQEHFDEIEAQARAERLAFVVDFTATWCKPCKAIAPLFDELCAAHPSTAIFAKVDVDDMQDLAMERGVAAMPTFNVYDAKGSMVAQVSGAREAALRDAVEKHCK